jgi:mutator protein MutT
MHKTHPSKVYKFCSRCGSPELKHCTDLSFKCDSCGFHFYINAAAAVAALVVNEEGKVLLTKRGVEPDYGKLDLPGGFLDPGETAEEALKRELHEELGLKVKTLEYFSSAPNEYIFSGITVFTLDLAFKVIPKSTANLKAMDDILDFRFYSENEIDYDLIPAPSINYFVKQYFKNE